MRTGATALVELEVRVTRLEDVTEPADSAGAALAAEWVRLATSHLDGAYRLAGYLLGNRDEAEDATQEAFIRAWRAWPQLRDHDSFDAWLDRIVANVCRSRLRRRRGIRWAIFDDELEVAAADPFRGTIDRDAVARAMERLTPEQRVVVVFRYWRDMSLEQIATHLGLPLGTVKSRLHYAQRAMRREIGL
jgi:RNA polymerase sigma-70 factor, ECF subfamily